MVIEVNNDHIKYIPFEGRIDQTSFEILLSETRPKGLILLGKNFDKMT